MSGLDDVDRQVYSHVAEHGHSVVGVPDGDPPFAYTVGLSDPDHPKGTPPTPELFITGALPPTVMQQLLNDVAALPAETLYPGAVLKGLLHRQDLDLVLVECDPQAAEMNMATRFYGDRISALQVLWPDTNNHFPTDPEWEYQDDSTQPLYTPTQRGSDE